MFCEKFVRIGGDWAQERLLQRLVNTPLVRPTVRLICSVAARYCSAYLGHRPLDRNSASCRPSNLIVELGRLSTFFDEGRIESSSAASCAADATEDVLRRRLLPSWQAPNIYWRGASLESSSVCVNFSWSGKARIQHSCKGYSRPRLPPDQRVRERVTVSPITALEHCPADPHCERDGGEGDRTRREKSRKRKMKKGRIRKRRGRGDIARRRDERRTGMIRIYQK